MRTTVPRYVNTITIIVFRAQECADLPSCYFMILRYNTYITVDKLLSLNNFRIQLMLLMLDVNSRSTGVSDNTCVHSIHRMNTAVIYAAYEFYRGLLILIPSGTNHPIYIWQIDICHSRLFRWGARHKILPGTVSRIYV